MTTRTIFVGRARELAELAALARKAAPLVTVWGPGGAGKTTLVRRHLEALSREPVDGTGPNVVWADLSTSRNQQDLVATLAASLGVTLDGRDDATEAVARSASAQRVVIVADNAEQLDGAARDVLVMLAERGARILATSRAPLDAPLETVIAIEPLPEDEALALFVELSGAAPDDSAREIVRRLSALPLALELAAARVPMLGSGFLLERLDRKLDLLGGPADRGDRHARHGTLRAAIAWSWDLLDEAERTALLACATFEAPFDIGLVTRVIGGDELGAIDAVEHLRRKALVHLRTDSSGAPELHLLEAVRDFARVELEARGNTVSREIFGRHAAAIVERTEPLAAIVRRGGAAPVALSKRRADLFAASRSIDEAAPELVVRATLALAALLSVTGPFDPVLDVVERLRSTTTDERWRLRLAIVEGEALRAVGRHVEADEVATRAQAGADVAGDELIRADALRLAGAIARSRGDGGRAIAPLQDARARYERLEEHALAGICLGELGAAYLSEGQLPLALRHHAEAIAVHVAEGSLRAEGEGRSYLAVATHRGGDVVAAVPLHEAALAIHRRAGHRRLEGAELLHLGFVSHEAGSSGRARDAFADARRVLAAAGARGLEALAIVLAARLEVDEGDVASARVLLLESAKAMPRGWPRLEATRLLVTAHLAMAAGEFASAVTAYESAWTTSRDVEVGFEALTPAYLALAKVRRARGHADAAREPSSTTDLVDEARRLTSRVANPRIAEALEILDALIHDRPPPTTVKRPSRASSEIRRALSFGSACGPQTLAMSSDGRLVVLPDGREIDLSRRKNVRLVLVALAKARADRPGAAVSAQALIDAGWPGERMRAEAAHKRLHTAIWTLRSVGLEALIVSSEDGYMLDPIELAYLD